MEKSRIARRFGENRGNLVANHSLNRCLGDAGFRGIVALGITGNGLDVSWSVFGKTILQHLRTGLVYYSHPSKESPMRIPLVISVACLALGMARAENLNLNETPETTSVALSPYSLGGGLGVLGAVTPELSDESNAFLKITIAQTVRFQDHWDVGMDLDWWLPGNNLGGTINLDYVFNKGPFRPFIGAGVGMQNIGYYAKFGQGFGGQGTAHAGIYFDIMDELQLRVRVPYHFVANANMDQAAGLDIALLFSSPHRNTKVKKLKY